MTNQTEYVVCDEPYLLAMMNNIASEIKLANVLGRMLIFVEFFNYASENTLYIKKSVLRIL